MNESNCFFCPSPGTPCQDGHCAPFKVCYGEGVGHYMVAVRDIKPMEVVMREMPVVVGPYTQTAPQCLQCCAKVDGSFRCPRCNYPMCNQACSEGDNHAVECELFVKCGWRAEVSDMTVTDSQYAAITVIRLLELKSTQPEVFARLMRLEDHNEKRQEEEEALWSYHQQHVVTFLKKVCLVDNPESEILSVLGKMFTNCGDLELPVNHGRGNGFYPTYANMNHSCRANTKTFKYPDQRLEVRAQVRIPKGSEISTQYVQSMKATYARRPVLRAKWYFDCACDRCVDPTECDSYLSALLCPSPSPSKPCLGLVLSCNPLSGPSDWSCQTCSTLYSAEYVITLVTEAAAMIDTPREEDDIIQHYERTIHHYSTTLHPSHYLIIGIKEKLAQIYGNYIPYKLPDLSRPLKERKIQVCQDMLDTISIVDPGFTKTRGQMLAEMNKTKLLVAKEDLQNGVKERETVNKKRWEKACLEKQFLHMYLAYYQSLFHGKKKT